MKDEKATSGAEQATDDQQSQTTTSQGDDQDFEYLRDQETSTAQEEQENNESEEDESQEVIEDDSEEVDDISEEEEEDQETDQEKEEDQETDQEDDNDQKEKSKSEQELQDKLDTLEEKYNKVLDFAAQQADKVEGEKKKAERHDTQVILEADEQDLREMIKTSLGDRVAESNLDVVDLKLIAALTEQRAKAIEQKLEPLLGSQQVHGDMIAEENKLIEETDGDIFNYLGRIQQATWKKYKGKLPEKYNKVGEYREMYQTMKSEEKKLRAKKYAQSKNVQANRKTATPPKTKSKKAPPPKESKFFWED